MSDTPGTAEPPRASAAGGAAVVGGGVLQPGQFGPVERGGRGTRSVLRRVAVVAATGLLVMALAATATAGVLLYIGNDAIRQLPIEGLTGDSPPDQAAPGETAPPQPDVEEVTDVINILVVGSDTREGLSDQELRELGTEDTGTKLTDTVMLLNLDPNRDRAAIISFPRDLYLERCDGSKGRINGAYLIGEERREGGGPDCLVQTVKDFAGVPIDHYVEVDLAGFIDVVDALGGVRMYLEDPLVDRYAGLDLPAGCVTLDGKRALGFVRARRIDNDFGRIARQQRFAREMLRQAISAETLTNIPKLFNVVRAAGRAVTTDNKLTVRMKQRIAFSLRELTVEGVESRTVPGAIRTIGGGSYVVADEIQSAQLFNAVREGTIFPEEVGVAAPEPVGVDDVPPVRVLNGTGAEGRARAAADQLLRMGFTVRETDNALRDDFRKTQVVFPPHLTEEAALVARAYRQASLVPGDPTEPLTVVVGLDFDPDDLPTRAEAFPPTAEPTPDEVASPSPSPSASPSPSPSASPSPSRSASPSASPSPSRSASPSASPSPSATPIPTGLPPEPTIQYSGAQISDVDC